MPTKQRVAIARGLAMDPEGIFFDETISASSPERRDELLCVMRKLADNGMTRLVVTHEIPFAREAADRVIFCREASLPCSTSEPVSSAGSSG
ncbi:hypothetical protein AAGT95_14445 [Salinicola lusitanus]|uniref:ABC transporter domain-containing protein n=1 Tax=Salinicola lusitanus TaxID=1949085 RepID=A0ABZ3CPE5_9GAMM